MARLSLCHRSRSGASVSASDLKQNAITHYSGLGGLEADPGLFGERRAGQCPDLAAEPELLLGCLGLQPDDPGIGLLDVQDSHQQEQHCLQL